MDRILEECEKSLRTYLEQQEQTRNLICAALEAVKKAQLHINRLPSLESKEELVNYLISNLSNQDQSEDGVREVTTESNTNNGSVIETTTNYESGNEDVIDTPAVDVTQSTNSRDEEKIRQEENAVEPQENCNKVDGIANEVIAWKSLSSEDFPCPDLDKAKKIKVGVSSSLSNVGTFWCVPCGLDIRTEQNKLSEIVRSCIFTQKEVSSVTKVEKDRLYCAFAKSENLYLRGFVENEMPDNQVQLRFVDTGTQGTFSLSKLTHLPTEFYEIEYIAYHCCLFPGYNKKLPYEAKWKFNDETKGMITYLYLEEGAKSGKEPISCFRLESGLDRLDVRLDVWQFVQESMTGNEAFSLPAQDVRKPRSVPARKETYLDKSDVAVKDEREICDKTGGIQPEGSQQKVNADIGDTKLTSDLTSELHGEEGSEMSWADICSGHEEWHDMDFSVAPDLPIPDAGIRSKDTDLFPEVCNSTDAVTTLNSDGEINQGRRPQDDMGQSELKMSNRPKQRERLIYQPIKSGKGLLTQDVEGQGRFSKGDVLADSRGFPSRNDNYDDAREQHHQRNDRDRKGDRPGGAWIQKPGNITHSQLYRKPLWRFSIKRLGLTPHMNKSQWSELQLKGLRFKHLQEKTAKFIILFTTQQRLEFLLRLEDFTPLCQIIESIKDVLETFDKQPIFIIFVRFDPKYQTKHIAGVGLVTSPLFDDRRHIKFRCDLLCSTMLRRPYTDIYEDGQVITHEQGIMLVKSIEDALQSGDVEDSIEYKGDLPPAFKGLRRDEGGFGSPQNQRSTQRSVSPSSHLGKAIQRDHVMQEHEDEDWDKEETPAIVEQENTAVISAHIKKLNFDQDVTPFTVKSMERNPTRDLKAEMEIFGLDENDI